MLARALFEATVDAYCIARHPAEAQRLGALHFRHTRLLVAEHWNEHERRDGDPALPLFTEDIRDRAELARQFGTKAQRHWTGKGLPERIVAVEDGFPQARDGELQARYADDNRLANLLLHGGGMALNDRITDIGFGNATIHVGPSEQHLANGLRHAYWSYQRLVLLIAERRAPTVRPAIEQLYADGWPVLQTITTPALKKAGRNGPCPCGSDRKVKDCHGRI
jgi:SEC-C motif